MSSAFADIYDILNSAQKEAVDTIDGPVLVIAGPGTGKTQILAARILNILSKTDTGAEEILCLTYTDAGSIAMRTRLAKFLGAQAYKVHIHTFHSLCNKIIQENPEYFSKNELTVMDEVAKVRLLDELLWSLPDRHILKSYNEVQMNLRFTLSKLFEIIQKEGLTVDWIQNRVEEILANVTDHFPDIVYKKKYKENNPGDIKVKDLEKLKEQFEKLIAASALYEQYNQRKKEKGLYEFADMLTWVDQAFEHHPDLLLNYQEKFQYILVDEYQDNSGLQNKLLKTLVSYWEENPNLFVVGDDDQSIYSFQGANVRNMEELTHRYEKNIKTVVLKNNYRSSQHILNASLALIKNNKERLIHTKAGLDKQLLASGENASLTQIPDILSFENEVYESAWIIEDIKKANLEGTPFHEMAVLSKKHSLYSEIAKSLKAENIPYHTKVQINLLREPLVRMVLDWLYYLNEEWESPGKGDYLLYPLFHFPIYPLEASQIAMLSQYLNQERQSWRKWLDKNTQQRDLLAPVDESFHTHVNDLWKEVNHWLKEMKALSTPQLIEQIIARSGVLKYALSQADKDWNLEVLHNFLNFVSEENERNPFMHPNELLETFDFMEKNEIPIPLIRRIGAGDGVALTTFHSAKGLEFDRVYLIGCNERKWKPRPDDNPFKVKYLFGSQEEKELSEEDRRLFYVGMTRARKQLYISFSKKELNGKEAAPVAFVQEILDTHTAQLASPNLPSHQISNLLESIVKKTGVPTVLHNNESWLREKLEDFRLAPTAVLDYLKCGLRFYFNHIIRIPRAGNEHTAFGNAMHNTVNQWLRIAKEEQRRISSDEVIKLFEKNMFLLRNEFNKNTYDRRLKQGKAILPGYFESREPYFRDHPNVLLEKSFLAVVENIPIKGRIDKLQLDGKQVKVVDYKTGKYKSGLEKLKAATDKKVSGDYWFQLSFYHLLVIHDQEKHGWEPISGVIDFMEPNDDEKYPIHEVVFNADDLSLVVNYTKEAYRGIMNLEFLQGCGKSECEYCKMATETGIAVNMPAEEEFNSAEN